MTITEADYQRMPWHARQTLNARLRAETKALEAELARIRYEMTRTMPQVVFANASEILANLHTDPDAAAHRVALDRELFPRRAA